MYYTLPMLLFPAPNIFAICVIYSPETNSVAGVLLFDETLQVQTGARQSGIRHGMKISNQERYPIILIAPPYCLYF